MASFHDHELDTLDGEPRPLSDYKGKVCLVVNVASKCGLTPQYEGLQRLHEKLSPRGALVLGFPCNQFAGQEPGTPDEIRQFCSRNYGVSFPLFEKIEVNGSGRHPLYAFLTSQETAPDGPGDIKWNFAKFVVDGDGRVVARFGPQVEPESPEVVAAIEGALA